MTIFDDGMTMRRKYREQRRRASQRGVAWDMTFEAWEQIWLRSGKWKHRGTSAGSYVMTRHEDAGPYAPWNVEIETQSANGKAAARYRKARGLKF